MSRSKVTQTKKRRNDTESWQFPAPSAEPAAERPARGPETDPFAPEEELGTSETDEALLEDEEPEPIDGVWEE